MIKISQEERYLIEDLFPGVMIKRTMKQKSKRKSYYVEENPDVKRYLEELRNSRLAENAGKEFSHEKYRKTREEKPDFKRDFKRKPRRNNDSRDWNRHGRSGGFQNSIYDYFSYSGDKNGKENNRKPRYDRNRSQNDDRRGNDRSYSRHNKGGRNFAD